MFFPRNSFVTNTTLTHTNTPRERGEEESRADPAIGSNHIACYGGHPEAVQVEWHNSSGQLQVCRSHGGSAPCKSCGPICRGNGGVGVDPPLNGHTDIHMYTNSTAYVNQGLECRVSSGQSAFIGVYLINGGECCVSCMYKL